MQSPRRVDASLLAVAVSLSESCVIQLATVPLLSVSMGRSLESGTFEQDFRD
jgi:hypothetical protein